MSTLLWLLLPAVYITLFVTLALTTLRKGHYLLFWVGIIFPVLWIFGALIYPASGSRRRLRPRVHWLTHLVADDLHANSLVPEVRRRRPDPG
jgi:hypothetical protein